MRKSGQISIHLFRAEKNTENEEAVLDKKEKRKEKKIQTNKKIVQARTATE